ncbi:MAG TPA: hypothetical protein VGF67_09405 [Ktedonobacteraceae bacterium]
MNERPAARCQRPQGVGCAQRQWPLSVRIVGTYNVIAHILAMMSFVRALHRSFML